MTIESTQPFIVWIHTEPETVAVVHCRFSAEASERVSRLGNERAGRTIISGESHYSPILVLLLVYPELKEKYSYLSIKENEYEIWAACYPGKSLQEEARKIFTNNSKLIEKNPNILNQLGMPGIILEAQEFLGNNFLRITAN